MSHRKAKAFFDPTARRVLPVNALAQLGSILLTLDQQEREIVLHLFGLLDGRRRTPYAIYAESGISFDTISAIEVKVESILQHAIKTGAMKDFTDEELDPDRLRTELLRLLGYTDELPPLVWCEKHGWHDPGMVEELRFFGAITCSQCPCPIRDRNSHAIYCSSACRQAAYRSRKGSRHHGH